MWIRLLAWMLADEEPSLPAPGDLLAGVGIRGGTTAAAPSDAVDGIEEVLLTGVRPQDAEYVLTGTVSSIRDYYAGEGAEGGHAGAECVLDTGTDDSTSSTPGGRATWTRAPGPDFARS